MLPLPTLEIIRASQAGKPDEVTFLSATLEPLWGFFNQFGSLRTIATMAELLGLVKAPCLPLPLVYLRGDARKALHACIQNLNL